ncbi:radical S-adenosyl methionine domain-containing protein 2-like isoform X1 [Aphidius gifuensis]|uniref:radical S-adenosyl methionine domain-containing protein 2-like isoform X1 n=2 Tax=Aphidius gifuensis TaxID=684658 RepID=UPI001CDCE914|nr:radical S-adenosyl methionine domain-containing protein 2-like isoform X1 [Aphidius gifuensis]XP_044001465.1 radical S-adenosyl methionine domain-containing protein 2-like isoform X1 [Aphidius gifuensis]XP_044001467.1 radical S-adenosyl methionine domain-containing protein 2-like isoform X1 [Aphidius gifuensis]XP_044001468.1 radical S-adenosyl methionine domain-containing protein 2-like isoform X1 [Aphidius gifuensis]
MFVSSKKLLINLCNYLRKLIIKIILLKIISRTLRININKLMKKTVPVSVNYHFTRQCNYSCGFCFHTAKTSYVLPLDVAKHGLTLLANAGMKKINFSGGEPFIKAEFMGELIKYCKIDLSWANINVSIVSNGSLIRENWMRCYGEYVDILAISCDSFDKPTNDIIGRRQGSRTDHVGKLKKVKEWCDYYKIAFKINTVINTYNLHEDFTNNITQLGPIRWKVFQCLLLEGENSGEDALRNAKPFYITDVEFDDFLKRHKGVANMVPENNTDMCNSYLILDEYMQFLNCQGGKKIASKSLLDIGVDEALGKSGFDEKTFFKRGGIYVWSKRDLLDW